MKYVKHTYEDPTGGGEDIILTVPAWVVDVPDVIRVTDAETVVHKFDYAGEQEPEED